MNEDKHGLDFGTFNADAAQSSTSVSIYQSKFFERSANFALAL
jgi:hypothetical protein